MSLQVFWALVLVLAGTLYPQGPTWAADDPIPRVPQSVRDRVQREGTVRLLVELVLPHGHHVPEGHLGSAAAVARQRKDIGDAQDAVAARLHGKPHRIVRRYETVPYLAVEVGPEGLAELEAAHSHVRRVTEPRVFYPQLNQSVPLIGGDKARSVGFRGTGWMVAIIDTGVDRFHPFLANKVVEEACYSYTGHCPNGLTSQLGAGAAAPCTFAVDCNHGTHVAGIAAGRDDDVLHPGHSGVAPDAQIVAIMAASCPWCVSARFDDWDLMAALGRVQFLNDFYPIAAVNMSLGDGHFVDNCDADPLKSSIDNLTSVGIAVVVASGNQGYSDGISRPACISTAVSVGATTKTDRIWWDSADRGSNSSEALSILAPGYSITSSVPGGNLAAMSGTSMATPHVTGAFAVMRQALPSASVDEILARLKGTGVPILDTRNGLWKPRLALCNALGSLSTIQLGASTVSVGEWANKAQIPVTRAGGCPEGGATVGFATTPGTATAGADYTPTSGTLTFGPAITSTSIPVSIAIDAETEADETFGVTLLPPGAGTVAQYAGHYVGRYTGTNTFWGPENGDLTFDVTSGGALTAHAAGDATGSVSGSGAVAGSGMGCSFSGSLSQMGTTGVYQGSGGYSCLNEDSSISSGTWTVRQWKPAIGAPNQAVVTIRDETPVLTVSPTTVPPGSTITVTLTEWGGGTTDWLTLVPSNSPNGTYSGYTYVTSLPGDSTRTWVTKVPATLGTYEVRLHRTTALRLATGPPITVMNINPTPAITALGPASVVAGAGALALTVTGTGFVPGAVVQVDGAPRTTTFASGTQVTAALLAADVATITTRTITVVNPGPCVASCISAGMTLPVTAPPPAPTLAQINPATAAAGASSLTLVATGTNFVPTSVVQVNGAARPTTYASSTQLSATVPASDLASAATLTITVFTPAPGGGTSAGLPLAVIGPALAVSPSTGPPGSTLTVTLTNWAGGPNDWLTLVPTSSPPGYYDGYVYVRDLPPGSGSTRTWTRTLPAALGTYEVRLQQTTAVRLAVSPVITVANLSPTPAITALSPAAIAAGSPAFPLTVTGSGFVPGASVRLDGSARTTTVVSGTQLTASILAADVATITTRTITVVNPAPCVPTGCTSSGAPLAVTTPPPAPTLTQISPTTVAAGATSLMLVAAGTSFVPSSVVQVNGAARPTTYTSPTQLGATLPATDLATATTLTITVFTAAPGGGTSAGLPLTVTGPALAVSPTTGPPGSTVTVTLTNWGGAAGDWLTIAPAAAPNAQYGSWVYVSSLPGDSTRTWLLTLPAALGTYEVRLFGAGFVRKATSGPIMVMTRQNLTPYQPLGWSDRIVVSRTPFTSVDSPDLTTADVLYVDWAVVNEGPDSTGDPFNVQIFGDDILLATWRCSALDPGAYCYVQDATMGTVPAGVHTVRIVVDPEGAIAETDETDNQYTKTITVR